MANHTIDVFCRFCGRCWDIRTGPVNERYVDVQSIRMADKVQITKEKCPWCNRSEIYIL